MIKQPPTYWGIPQLDLLAQLNANKEGLSSEESRKRLIQYGANLLRPPAKRSDTISLLLAQFKSPIVLTLMFAAGLSSFLHDPTDAIIILFIVLVSGLLGFWQERGAVNTVEKLLAIVSIKATVIRDKSQKDIPIEDVVPGDILILNAGDAIPADSLILESADLFVDEATLMGETYPVEKEPGVLPVETHLGARTNCLFMAPMSSAAQPKRSRFLPESRRNSAKSRRGLSSKFKKPNSSMESNSLVFYCLRLR